MNYENAKIYQILNTIDKEVYVGSTIQPLSKRFSLHRSGMTIKKNANRRLNKHFRELGRENFYIELIENFPCQTREQLCAREGFYVRQRGTLNKNIPGRSQKESQREYQKAHSDEIKNYHQKYYLQCAEYKCECGSCLNEHGKSRHELTKKHQKFIKQKAEIAQNPAAVDS
jgi:GIY-YIG catalytic domain